MQQVNDSVKTIFQNCDAVLFDMDGLLINSQIIYYNVWKETLSEKGLAKNFSKQFYMENFAGFSGSHWIVVLERNFGRFVKIEPLWQRAGEIWNAYVAQNGIEVQAGALNLISRFKSMRKLMGLVTANDRASAESLLHATNLYNNFATIITGDDFAGSAMKAEGFTLAAQRLGVPIQRCVAFDDCRVGIGEADKAGAISIMVPDAAMQCNELSDLATLVIPSLESIDTILSNTFEGSGSNLLA